MMTPAFEFQAAPESVCYRPTSGFGLHPPANRRAGEVNARSCPAGTDSGFWVRRPLRGLGMIESISAPFIRFPIGTSLLMAGILFIGLVHTPCYLLRRCRRSTSRPSRSARLCPARAPKPWPRRWRSRWNGS